MNLNRTPEDDDEFKSYLLRRQKESNLLGVLIRVLFLAVAGSIAYLVISGSEWLQIKHWTENFSQSSSPPAPSLFSGAINGDCDASPPQNGSINVIDPSAVRRTDLVFSGLNFSNQHTYPIVVLIGSPNRQQDYEAVYVSSGGQAEVSLPIGSYGMTLLVGRTWCNIKSGFSDGHRIIVSNLTEILSGETNRIIINSSGQRDIDVHLESTQNGPAQLQAGRDVAPSPLMNLPSNGTLELHRQNNGSFYVNGTIQNIPLVFQIDTGASVTSIPQEIAWKAGLYGCNSANFDTANGSVLGCIVKASEFTFGPNRLTGFDVAVMPNLKGALLGMNALRFFKIENVGDIMRISPNTVIAPAPLPEPPMNQPANPLVEREAQNSDTQISIRAQLIDNCEKAYKTSKDAINTRMREAYSSEEGEVFRERLREVDKTHMLCLGQASKAL